MWTHPLILFPLLGGLLCLGVAVYLVVELNRRNRGNASMIELSRTIRNGTHDFLRREYLLAGFTTLAVFALIGLAQTLKPGSQLDWTVALAFLLGAGFTVLAGGAGLGNAVRANSRTAEAARLGGITSALGVALGAGAVMGLFAVGLALIGLSIVTFFFKHAAVHAFACALGSSLVAMFVRLSGGIYTKGADIGADFITRSEPGFGENDVRNAAVIADHVGDNIGGVIGIGSNLMESYLEAIIAAMAIAATLETREAGVHSGLFMLPLLVAAAGALASLAGIFFIRLFVRNRIQTGLALAVGLSVLLTLGASWFLVAWLGESYRSELDRADCTRVGIFVCLALGFAAGALTSFFSGLYTSYQFRPTRRISERSQFGTALAVLEGLSVGMKSTGVQTLILAGTLVLAFRQAEFYGITLAAVGMLAIVGLVIALNAFGPVVDNAGGIAEMVRMDRSVRDIMENLHGLSNATTAMGKGFATSSATFVAIGLLIAFIKVAGLTPAAMSFDHPAVLAGLLVGAMFPFYLGALLIHAVGSTASAMIDEVRRQIREIPGLREGKTRPDTMRCTELATRRAVRGVIAPAALVIAAPLLAGLLFGKAALAGFLAGALVCSLALGFQMVNAGGAMDNAKKYIEEGYFGGKGSDAHKSAVVGDTVGDSFKDTVGPALSIMIKLMCVIALLIAPLLK